MTSPDALPSLRDVIKSHGLDAKKNLGQHFLLDMNVTRKIARLAGISSSDRIIEIGPGPGGLTRALLETGAKICVIERDERCLDLLAELELAYGGQLTVRSEDALRTDYSALLPDDASGHIISNLPYNISTELLTRWLTRDNGRWQRMTLMFQKEVADRILAPPDSKTYGRLSVLSQTASHPHRGLDLPARAFTPPPKVASSVVVFEALPTPFAALKSLEHVTRHAFSQRRKMLRSTLKPVFGDNTLDVLNDLGIPPTARAEQLSVATFQSLAQAAAHLTIQQ